MMKYGVHCSKKYLGLISEDRKMDRIRNYARACSAKYLRGRREFVNSCGASKQNNRCVYIMLEQSDCPGS
jgi:hypothetical protein